MFSYAHLGMGGLDVVVVVVVPGSGSGGTW